MDVFIGTILAWAPTFAPRSYSYCNGGLIAISQNSALFSLVGTNYGGDGITTFGLPDLRSRVPIGAGMGAGPGLSFYPLGVRAGVEDVTLTQITMPSHSHVAQGEIRAYDTPGTSAAPQAGEVLANGVAQIGFNSGTANIYAAPSGSAVTLSPSSVSVQIGNSGGNQPHENRMPFSGISFIIALFGIYPSRS